ncbi:MAG: carbohydrate kinase family protein [Erysipelotrichaceae bacterium]|nr:carbohydrate kinase family protein [Erysipelotrichaceae bacterium]
MSKVNVIGAACMDILIYPVDQESFFSGKYKAEHIRMLPGGDALNEALILSHFKADTKLITILGNDLLGHQLLTVLQEGDVSCSDPVLKDDIETYISIVCIDEKGQRTFVGNRNGSVRKLKAEDIRIDDDCEIVSFASLFISESLNDQKLEVLFSEIKRKGKILCVDCSTPKHQEKIWDMRCLKHADYFFCNQQEAESLMDQNDLYEIDKCFHENGVNAIIKCGSNGAFYQNKMYATDPIVPVDTTGAGDSFVAGFITGLLKNETIEECIMDGNRFGAKACAYLGATEWIKYE